MSRIRIFVLLATVVALAGVLAACGGDSDSSGEDPQGVIENATLEGVKSGDVSLSIGIVSEGGEDSGDLKLSLSGPFQSRGNETLPELGLDVTANGNVTGDAIDFDGGLTLLSDRAFVRYNGTEYEVDPTTFGFVKSGFEQGFAEGSGGSATSPTACQEAVSAIDLNTVIENLSNEGSADVDGTSTTKVSGDLNPDGAIDAIIALTEDPACASTLEAAGPLPLDELEQAKGEISKALKEAHIEVYVGDDNIIRKVVTEITVEPKTADGEKVDLDFEMSIGGVNEKQTIEAPANAEPLEGLFKELDVDPMALLEAGSGGGLDGLLEGVTGAEGGVDGGEVEIEPEDLPDVEESTAYLECLGEATTANDLQKCAQLIE
ncbi:MAG TPA: hypothetical protein VFB52_11370 [Solirubrobacterales bacterium]|nr:hypothetical protein [Solirubrobacterales bacterium]